MMHFRGKEVLLCFLTLSVVGAIFTDAEMVQSEKYRYLNIDGIEVAPRTPRGIIALIADEFTPGSILFATKIAVYTLNVSSWESIHIVGGADRGYAEGRGVAALFVKISAMEIGPLTSNFWVADYATGCIREVNRFTAQTQPIVTRCSYVNGLAKTGLSRITSLCKVPASSAKYYVAFMGGLKLALLTNNIGYWETTEILTMRNRILDINFVDGNYYLLTSTTLFVGVRGSDLYTAVIHDLNETSSKTNQLFVINKRILLTAGRGNDINIVDVIWKRKFSMCRQFQQEICHLQSIANMVKHPTKPNTLLAAGSRLYTIPYGEQAPTTTNFKIPDSRGETTVEIVTTKRNIGFLQVAAGGLLTIIIVAIIVFTTIYTRKLLAKPKKMPKKTVRQSAAPTFPTPFGTPVYIVGFPDQSQLSFGPQQAPMRQTQFAVTGNMEIPQIPEKQGMALHERANPKDIAEEKQPQVATEVTTRRNSKRPS